MTNPSDRTEWFTDDEVWLDEVKTMVADCESIAAGLKSALEYIEIHEDSLKLYQRMIESSEKLLAAEGVIALADQLFTSGDKPTALEADEHAINENIHNFVGDFHSKLLERHVSIMEAEKALKASATR